MKDLLSIRVMAQTLDEKAVAERWSGLCQLVWPNWMTELKIKNINPLLSGDVIMNNPVEKALGGKPHGVVELATALADILRFGQLPEELKSKLAEGVKLVEKSNQQLASALSTWKTQDAVRLAQELQENLDKAELDLGIRKA